MKKQIIASILFIFCYGCVNGQVYIDSTVYYPLIVGKTDSIYLDTGYTVLKKTKSAKDTVRVLMLVSDTVHVIQIDRYFKAGGKVVLDTIDFGNKGTGSAYWTYGFEERFKECCINGNNSQYTFYQPEPYYTHIRYLDSDKKELKESIVVWISKEIKN